MILIWSFPDGSPAFVQALNVIVWASFAVVARLVLSVAKAMFVRTHKLDQLMVLLPMLRFLRIFLLLRRSPAFVSTEKIAGSIVSIVIVGFASAFFKWRVEHDAPGTTMTTFRAAIWWALAPPPQWTTATTPGHRRRPDRR